MPGSANFSTGRARRRRWRRDGTAMESDKHYLLEGIFVIVLALAAASTFIWLSKTGHRDDVLYRVAFNESVSGLKPGEPVKYHGVDVGVVKAMSRVTQGAQRDHVV